MKRFFWLTILLLTAGVLFAATSSEWTLRNPQVVPTRRSFHALAYDSVRANAVLFGGFGLPPTLGCCFSDTWTWDGTAWTQRFPAHSPSLRYNHSMVFDEARGEVVLFGGFQTTGSVFLNDTWVWNGTDWTQKSPATSPSARDSFGLVYDAARQEVVLFGGGNGPKNDTWVWNGTNWSQKFPAANPPVRYNHAMAYDSQRSETVLYGGFKDNNATDMYADTWVWNGTNWAQKSPGAAPPARVGSGTVYSDLLQGVVLFGGSEQTGGAPAARNDTWLWNGTTWSLLSPTVKPATTHFSRLISHTPRKEILSISDALSFVNSNTDTWIFRQRPRGLQNTSD